MGNLFGYKGLVERLDELNSLLESDIGFGSTVEITIVGGSALMASHLVSDARMTMDIDLLEAEDCVLRYLDLLDMNMDVNTFLYSLPDGWRHRRREFSGTWSCLKVYVPSGEDLAIMKLVAGRATDIRDLESMADAGKLDFERVQGILDDVSEVELNLDDAQWQQLVRRFEDLKNRYSQGGTHEKAST